MWPRRARTGTSSREEEVYSLEEEREEEVYLLEGEREEEVNLLKVASE